MRARLLTACLLLLAIAPAAAPADAAGGAGWDYRVQFDEGLQEMRVEICFRRFLPRRFVLEGSLEGFDLTPADAGSVRLETQDDGSVVARGLRPGGCVRYRVRIDDMRRGRRWARTVSRVGKDLLVAPGSLFLTPALWSADADVGMRFTMPAGMRPAVPWPREAGGRYRLDRHALRLTALVAFGRFSADSFQVAGTTIDLAVLEGPLRASRPGIRRWITAAVLAVADLYGRFPTPTVTVLVQPVPSRSRAVLFGQAMRAGGGHVHLLLSSSATDDALPGEWVAIHELTHLGMPWTYESEAWLQEGFVTYYQEVLRARAGFLSEQEGWQRLHDGFERGRRSGGRRSLAEESDAMGREHNYRRVYWGGAAIALLIDLELRKRSGGRRSLDDAMRLMHRNFGGTRSPKHGSDLMRVIDRWLGRSLCSAISAACLREQKFPSLTAAYAALGLRVVGGRIELAPGGAQIAERTRIMRKGGR